MRKQQSSRGGAERETFGSATSNWAWAWASHSRDLVLRGANEKMKVKRDFEAICDHIKNLLEDGPMKWMDIRIKSR